MASGVFRLRVITPKEVKIDEDVNMLVVHSALGDMGVLPGHDDYTVLLGFGPLRIFNVAEERHMVVLGGTAEIKRDSVTIVTKEARWLHEIRRSDIERELFILEQKIQSNEEDYPELSRDEVLLERAQAMMRVASDPALPKDYYSERASADLGLSKPS